MTPDDPIEPVIDNANRFMDNGPDCVGLHRTIGISIEPAGAGYDLSAWGPSLPQHTSSRLLGHLDRDERTVHGWIGDLHRTWTRAVVDWTDKADLRPGVRHPFADEVDLRGVVGAHIDVMWRALAKAGYELFENLFYKGDDALRDVGDHLAAALRAEPQVITVHSDKVVVPWSMLYLPRWPGERLRDDFEVDLSGFWGYRHLVEHSFRMRHTPSAEIRLRGPIVASTYIDNRLDDDRPRRMRKQRIVAPVVSLIDRRTQLRQRSLKKELESDLDDVGLDDQLIYFCCHCVDEPDGVAALRLSDDEPITAGNFDNWLHEGGLRRRPLVFVNACDAGQLRSNSASHFSQVLLRSGASCLVGPWVSIPAPFARAFATTLLWRVLRPKEPLGEALRDVAVQFAERRNNPLGLAYCLYHGIDTHFCPPESEDDVPAA